MMSVLFGLSLKGDMSSSYIILGQTDQDQDELTRYPQAANYHFYLFKISYRCINLYLTNPFTWPP